MRASKVAWLRLHPDPRELNDLAAEAEEGKILKEKFANLKIFTITVLTKGGHDSRCWGYSLSLEDAQKWIKANYLGMDDNLFDYLVVESLPPGIGAEAEVHEWYKYIDNKWVICETPNWALHSHGFTIG